MKTLKLFGHIYSVEYIKDWHDDSSMAKITHTELAIKINANLAESLQEEALWHEIKEAINTHLELELEHNKINAMSEVEYMIIKDNDLFIKKKEKK